MLLAAIFMTAAMQSVSLPSFFSDNMVFQRDKPIPIWGEGAAGTEIEVKFNGQTAKAKADATGHWMLRLKSAKAGGPYELQVCARTIKNVMVGEVWICSGQSNMEWPVGASNTASQVIAKPDPSVRFFNVANVALDEPQKDVHGVWEAMTPKNVSGYSAVGYNFATILSQELGCTVGMIQSDWGGTPAESWTSKEALLAKPELKGMMETYMKSMEGYSQRFKEYQEKFMAWANKTYPQYADNKGLKQGWATLDMNVADWHEVNLPGTWEEGGLKIDGAVWYRKTIDLAPAWEGLDLTLSLGPIDDYDDTYFNGERVGGMTLGSANSFSTPRNYAVPGRLVHAGKNVIAVRVYDTGGAGGFSGTASQIAVTPKNSAPLSLAGPWLMKVESEMPPIDPAQLQQAPQAPFGPGNPWAPASLYNAMIAPLVPYGIRGAIWYQGESNADRAVQYRTLFPTMIQDWRTRFGQGDFPFLFVQLANFTERMNDPSDQDWAWLREAQTMTLKLKNSGMAMAIDIGEAGDIHPKNKKEVGRRLALNALAITYSKKNLYKGPTFKSLKIEGSNARVNFADCGTGLSTSDRGAPIGFSIAGADGKFYWAEAKIEGNSVVVSNSSVANPVAVRYAWANNPACNLVDSSGLPASPFRTDTWDRKK